MAHKSKFIVMCATLSFPQYDAGRTKQHSLFNQAPFQPITCTPQSSRTHIKQKSITVNYMRILSTLALMLCSWGFTWAQDRVITKEGDVMEVYRIDLGSTFIYYTLEDKDDAPLQKIAKADVLMIRKKDGTKIDVTAAATATAPAPPAQTGQAAQPGIVTLKREELTAEGKAANDALMEKLNCHVELVLKDSDKEDVGIKRAKRGFAILGVKQNSIIANEDIEVGMTLGEIYQEKKVDVFYPLKVYEQFYVNFSYKPHICFSVKNKQNKTLYLDLGNTFYVSQGQPVCYYIPTATTTSSGSSGGGSLNLGAVAGALGVGGAVGTLASGISVGGGSSKSTSTTTYSQRVIGIPPYATVQLSPKPLYPDKSYPVFNFSSDCEGGTMMVGDNYTYAEETSPLQMSFILAYSEMENCECTKSAPVNIYLRQLLGYRDGVVKVNARVNNDDVVIVPSKVTDKNGASSPKQ